MSLRPGPSGQLSESDRPLACGTITRLMSAPRVFLSYARSDGEAFAAALRRRLDAGLPDLTLWQDRSDLEGGIGWWKQIATALEVVDTLVMVMTPAVASSEVAQKEWRYARQQGVRVCPVLGVDADAMDFGRLPSWMRKAHCYDLTKEWESFVAFLRSPRTTSRVPFMAPDLRQDLVERPAEAGAIVQMLLDRERVNPLAITTALQGAGGFGKTTLATAICHDDDIVVAFDDGILWATLGQRPNLLQELTRLYAALTGERPAFVDAEDASLELAARLEDRQCLIVIDDVWDPNDAKPFLRGGRTCAPPDNAAPPGRDWAWSQPRAGRRDVHGRGRGYARLEASCSAGRAGSAAASRRPPRGVADSPAAGLGAAA